MKDNVEKLNKDYNWLVDEIGKFNAKPEEVLVAILNGDGTIFCQKKEGSK